STHGPRLSVRLGRGLDRPPVFPVGAPNGRLRRPFMDTQQFGAEDWRRFLSSLGEDPQRSGLLETPERLVDAWRDWTAGYDQDPAEVLKVFEDGAEQYRDLIVVRGIPVYSHCEHHLAPFFCTATIGYIPNGRIVGLSKLTRLVE